MFVTASGLSAFSWGRAGVTPTTSCRPVVPAGCMGLAVARMPDGVTRVRRWGWFLQKGAARGDTSRAACWGDAGPDGVRVGGVFPYSNLCLPCLLSRCRGLQGVAIVIAAFCGALHGGRGGRVAGLPSCTSGAGGRPARERPFVGGRCRAVWLGGYVAVGVSTPTPPCFVAGMGIFDGIGVNHGNGRCQAVGLVGC